MPMRLLRSIVVLPGTVLIIIPLFLSWVLRNTAWTGEPHLLDNPGAWFALFFVLAGISMIVWTVTLFTRVGRGTLAPWEPPRKLVIEGPFRHVRNPMISGVLSTLLAEALFFDSLAIGLWFIIFFIGNAVYLPACEEPDLLRRFGDEYREYCKNVPRWVPRVRPWVPKERST